ncbi:MAG: twin-arginine translocation signal domain-containing protein, partial [Thermoguttaceae bacterium]|nr:twin-arginine translocation signal domain-containing protein [Thermoguttaceae bacterium]
MQRQWTRRDFMATTALGAVAATANLNGFSTALAAEEYKTKLHSAFI